MAASLCSGVAAACPGHMQALSGRSLQKVSPCHWERHPEHRDPHRTLRCLARWGFWRRLSFPAGLEDFLLLAAESRATTLSAGGGDTIFLIEGCFFEMPMKTRHCSQCLGGRNGQQELQGGCPGHSSPGDAQGPGPPGAEASFSRNWLCQHHQERGRCLCCAQARATHRQQWWLR